MSVAWCVGARAAAGADAHAIRVVPAAGRLAGHAAASRRYAAILPPDPDPPLLRGRSSPREHGSLRACRLPRVFVLNPRAPVLCHCVRSLWCGGLTRRSLMVLFSLSLAHFNLSVFAILQNISVFGRRKPWKPILTTQYLC